jgi:hypothetical protein
VHPALPQFVSHIPCAPPRPCPFQQFHSFCRVHLALLEVFVNCLSPVPALQSSVCRQSYYSVSHRREPPSEYCCPPRCCQKTGCDSCTGITLLRADVSSHHLARFSFSFACVCLVCSLGQAHVQVVMHCEQRGSPRLLHQGRRIPGIPCMSKRARTRTSRVVSAFHTKQG